MIANPGNGGNGNGGSGQKRTRMDDIFDLQEFGTSGTFGIGPEQVTETELMSDTLDIFQKPITEDVMLYFREARYFPNAGLNDTG